MLKMKQTSSSFEINKITTYVKIISWDFALAFDNNMVQFNVLCCIYFMKYVCNKWNWPEPLKFTIKFTERDFY